MDNAASTPLNQITDAFRADDWEQVRHLLDRHPEFQQMIDEPVGPFDSSAIVSVRSREMLDVLVAAGADLNAKSRWWAGGFGLLHSAPKDVAAYAIERGAVVDIHAAARLGLMDKVDEFVSADPDVVHARGGDGQMPLHFAGSVEIAAFLLGHGADIDALDIDHESTPAQHMIDDRQEIVRYLIAQGCSTDILMATAVDDGDLVQRILNADPASIRIFVDSENFPMKNRKAGGTIYQWTLGFYMSAHQVARKYGRAEVLKLLIDRSPAAIRLIDACWSGDEAAVETLRTKFPEVTQTITAVDHRQVAHAARNNVTSAVRLMLESGLAVDAQGQHQGTALHWAAFHGNREMAEIILGFSPPLEAVDADFSATPLGWAVHGSIHGWYSRTGDYAGVVEALLRAGAERPKEIGGTAAVRDVLGRPITG